MHWFYIIALVPTIIGLILFILNKRVNWVECIIGTALAFLVSGIMHFTAVTSMVDDIECFSGQITHTAHFPQWAEEWQEAIYRTEHYTTGYGKNRQSHTRRVFSHYETRHTTHSEHYVAYLYFGEISEEKDICIATFNDIKKNFGNVVEDGGTQSFHHGGKFDGGDRKIYRASNKTGYIYPVTTTRHFENRVKAAPSKFSFVSVPSNAPVYNWPVNSNYMVSDRLINEPRISILEFDRMNSRLGPKKFVNVIMINFGDNKRSIAELQRSKFIGGKKNDLVLCYGQVNSNNVPAWAMVFGWSESDQCKRNLEIILLEHSISDAILPLIEQEILVGYVIKEWSKFDYLSVEPPKWAYWVLAIVMIITQTIFWIWSSCNEFDKDGSFNKYGIRSF
jgi:hypothetical protein